MCIGVKTGWCSGYKKPEGADCGLKHCCVCVCVCVWGVRGVHTHTHIKPRKQVTRRRLRLYKWEGLEDVGHGRRENVRWHFPPNWIEPSWKVTFLRGQRRSSSPKQRWLHLSALLFAENAEQSACGRTRLTAAAAEFARVFPRCRRPLRTWRPHLFSRTDEAKVTRSVRPCRWSQEFNQTKPVLLEGRLASKQR